MAEEGTKIGKNGDLPKDVLAPAEGPREHLVDTAVKFLQNPKVRQSPLYQKQAFLEKKGLTKEEIHLAVQRAGIHSDDVSQPQQPPSAYGNGNPLVSVPQPPPASPLMSSWSRTREVILTSAFIAAVSYAIYKVFKTYVRPWLLGKSETESRLERLESSIEGLQATIAKSNSQMLEILRGIQTTLSMQGDGVRQSVDMVGNRDTQSLSEVKAEISSVKALLLNRRQFPPTPVTAPIIPSWQLLPRDGKTDAAAASQKQEASDEQPPTDPTGEDVKADSVIPKQTQESNEPQPQLVSEEDASQKTGDLSNIVISHEPELSLSLTGSSETSPSASNLQQDNSSSSSQSSCETNGFEMVKRNIADQPAAVPQ